MGLKLDAGSVLSRWKSQSRSRLRHPPSPFICLPWWLHCKWKIKYTPRLIELPDKSKSTRGRAAWPRSPPYCFPMLGRITSRRTTGPVLLLVPNVTLPNYFTLMRKESNKPISHPQPSGPDHMCCMRIVLVVSGPVLKKHHCWTIDGGHFPHWHSAWIMLHCFCFKFTTCQLISNWKDDG